MPYLACYQRTLRQGSGAIPSARRTSLGLALSVTVTLVTLLSSPATQAAVTALAQGQGRQVTVAVNGRELPWQARLWQGVLLAPVRALAESLGAHVTWNAATSQVVLRKGNHEVRLRVGSPWAVVDGRRVELPWAPFLDGGRLHAPARFVATALGAGLSLDITLARAVIKEILPPAPTAATAAPATAPVAPNSSAAPASTAPAAEASAAAASAAAAAPPPTAGGGPATAASTPSAATAASAAATPSAAAAPAPTRTQAQAQAPVQATAQPAAPTQAAPAPRPAAALPPRLALAYYPVDYDGDMLANQSLARYGASVDVVALFGYRLLPDGGLDGGPAARHLPTLLTLTRRGGQRILAVIHNAAGGGFDRAAVSAFLADARARQKAVAAIVRLMEDGFAGVNLDLENVAPSDRARLTDFAGQLAAALRDKGYLFTMAVPAKTWDDPNNGWSAAYDYAALGRIADLLVIMAYDEHWAAGPAGPVASLPWVRNVAQYAAATIPAARILLGIAAYGYDWPPWGGATALSAPGAERLAARNGAAPRWDATAQVPFFRYLDSAGLEHTVYYENASSAAAKVDLVLQKGLRGVAVWRLGLEDPALWGMMDSKLR